jgi:hypothetical protein
MLILYRSYVRSLIHSFIHPPVDNNSKINHCNGGKEQIETCLICEREQLSLYTSRHLCYTEYKYIEQEISKK